VVSGKMACPSTKSTGAVGQGVVEVEQHQARRTVQGVP
jgi:hypothetical protein